MNETEKLPKQKIRAKVKSELSASSLSYVILFLFFIFWWQSGWYRVDCKLGITAACDLISAEYKGKKTP